MFRFAAVHWPFLGTSKIRNISQYHCTDFLKFQYSSLFSPHSDDTGKASCILYIGYLIYEQFNMNTVGRYEFSDQLPIDYVIKCLSKMQKGLK